MARYGSRVKARDGFKFVAVENHVKQRISLPSFNYLDEAEDWVTRQECIVEQAGYYTYAIYEVRRVIDKREERKDGRETKRSQLYSIENVSQIARATGSRSRHFPVKRPQ